MLHFDRYAREVLIRTSRNQVLSAFAESGLDEKDKELMAEPPFSHYSIHYSFGSISHLSVTTAQKSAYFFLFLSLAILILRADNRPISKNGGKNYGTF